MSAAATTIAPAAMTGCPTPIDKGKLDELIAKGRANPGAVKTLKCRTVAEGRFRHPNMIRTLPAHVIDEPPALLGDDTAPNPSEAALAALGSCLAVGFHANAVARGCISAPGTSGAATTPCPSSPACPSPRRRSSRYAAAGRMLSTRPAAISPMPTA